jgi:peptidoglycan hydrolase CwlO-like protein
MHAQIHTHTFLTKLSIVLVGVSLMLGACTVYAQNETREELERQLKVLEAEIATNKTILDSKKGERKSLERDIAILEGKVREAKLSIQRRDLSIKSIGKDITQTEKQIEFLNAKADRARVSLGKLVRKTNEYGEETLIEVLLRGDPLTTTFTDEDNIASIETKLQDTFAEIRTTQDALRTTKEVLSEKKTEQEELKNIQVKESEVIKERQHEKQTLVSVTKGQEKEYEKYIKEKEQSAAEIRNALFALRDSTAAPLSFGTMLRYADEASALTGVRAEVILAILTEESNLGKNIGSGTWTVDMHPDRDRPVFETLTKELGLDPDKMPVSKKPWYGWGGAMGPGQFIPSTWILYKDRIAKVTKQSPPNPWDPRTATYATALLMMDNGADKQTKAAERLAALRYLAGWKNATKPAYAFYGNEVMDLVEKYESQVAIVRASQ